MFIISHLLFGWVIGNYSLLEKRDRALAVAAAMAPDLDALSYVFGRSYYEAFHHEFFHSIAFCVFITLLMLPFAKEKIRGGFGIFAAGLSHLFADLIGTSWPMPLLWPFSSHYFTIGGILSEQIIYNVINPLAGLILLIFSIMIMVEFKRTPVEIVSPKYDRRLVNFFMLP
ncbi:MAG TPA: metal-dependent hydrolase [Euryarchaeota archaeon]|nr:metal-dependent hydrolase [Euryarchaeota archaeon]